MKKWAIIILGILLIPVISAAENPIKIKEMESGKGFLNISYDFDNNGFVGNKIDVEIWIIDFNVTEIKREVDSFPINKNGNIKRNFVMEVPRDLTGVYYVYMALSNDLDNFVKQSVVFGESKTTGNVVLAEGSGGKLVVYIIFVIVVVAVIIFISKSLFLKPRSPDEKGVDDTDSSKHGWLFVGEGGKKKG